MSDNDERRESFWGWGWESKFPDRDERENIGQQAKQLLGIDDLDLREPPELADVELEEPSVRPPAELEGICTDDKRVRARHTYGRAYRDIVRGFRGDFEGAPDVVARPETVEQVRRLLDWASGEGVAVIPFGGGTSVVGGVESGAVEGYEGCVSLDTRRMDAILEYDPRAGAARIQAGATGPRVAEQLEGTGQMLRHYPQSYEFSTVGGWIATRSGGHYATVYTHFEDFVESVRMVAPGGEMTTPRHPASGAGPEPDRLVAGSEGILGVITDAWVRTQDAPDYRSKATAYFSDFWEGVEATRALARSGLHPANCRLLDSREAMMNGVAFDGSSLLLLGFESANVPTRERLDSALELVRDFGGEVRESPTHRTPGEDDSVSSQSQASWRSSFFEAPYLQNTMVSLGVLADTFETACTWSEFDDLHRRLVQTTLDALEEVCGEGFVSCRFTHVYPDGPAPYYTFLGPADVGSELSQWREVKSAVSDVLADADATITHHHAVGRTHRPWYDEERPDLYAEGLQAAREVYDPDDVMNPGVLI